MNWIEKYTNDFYYDNNINYIVELNNNGTFSSPIQWWIIAFIALFSIWFFTSNETKDDEHLIDGTTSSPGTLAAIFVTLIVILSASNFFNSPKQLKLSKEYIMNVDLKMDKLKNSENIENNLIFINTLYYLEKYNHESYESFNPKSFIDGWYYKNNKFKGKYSKFSFNKFDKYDYIKQKFLKYKNIEIIKIPIINDYYDINVKDKKLFSNIVKKEFCYNKKCDFKNISKNTWAIRFLNISDNDLIEISKNFKKCDKYNFLNNNNEYLSKKEINIINKRLIKIDKKYKCKNIKEKTSDELEKLYNN